MMFRKLCYNGVYTTALFNLILLTVGRLLILQPSIIFGLGNGKETSVILKSNFVENLTNR